MMCDREALHIEVLCECVCEWVNVSPSVKCIDWLIRIEKSYIYSIYHVAIYTPCFQSSAFVCTSSSTLVQKSVHIVFPSHCLWASVWLSSLKLEQVFGATAPIGQARHHPHHVIFQFDCIKSLFSPAVWQHTSNSSTFISLLIPNSSFLNYLPPPLSLSTVVAHYFLPWFLLSSPVLPLCTSHSPPCA